MATYITLLDYTETGIRSIKDSPKRAEAFTETARSAGIEIRGLYWTVGSHDGVLIYDASDDAAATALMLALTQAGNVRTTTLRAFDRSEMEAILAKVP